MISCKVQIFFFRIILLQFCKHDLFIISVKLAFSLSRLVYLAFIVP